MIRTPRQLLAAASLFAALVAMAAVLLPGERLIEGMRALLLSISIGVVTAWAKVARDVMRQDEIDTSDIIIISVFLTNLGVCLWSTWGLFWRVMGQPDLAYDEHILSAIAMVSTFGAGLALIAPQAIEGRVPPRSWVKLGIQVAATSMAITTALVIVSWYTQKPAPAERPSIEERR